MEDWEAPRKVGLYHLFCHLPVAAGSEAGILGSVSSVFREKKSSILNFFFFGKILCDQGLCNVQSLKQVLLLN